MKYAIDGKQISIDDNKYWILSGELNKYSVQELEQAIIDIENVFNDKYSASSFYGEVVFSVEYDKDMAKIEYYNEYVGEEPTIEIYNMLKAYREKLKGYENKSPQI